MLGPAVNCTPEHAHQLGRLLQGRDVVVNLIPWNPSEHLLVLSCWLLLSII